MRSCEMAGRGVEGVYLPMQLNGLIDSFSHIWTEHVIEYWHECEYNIYCPFILIIK